jgi:hypothetical protein
VGETIDLVLALLQLDPNSDQIQTALAPAWRNLHTELIVENLRRRLGLLFRRAISERRPNQMVHFAQN